LLLSADSGTRHCWAHSTYTRQSEFSAYTVLLIIGNIIDWIQRRYLWYGINCWIVVDVVWPAMRAVMRSGDVMWVKRRDVIAAAAPVNDKNNWKTTQSPGAGAVVFIVVGLLRQCCACGHSSRAVVWSALLVRSCENCQPIITVPSANNAETSASQSSLWFATTIVAADASVLSSQLRRANISLSVESGVASVDWGCTTALRRSSCDYVACVVQIFRAPTCTVCGRQFQQYMFLMRLT